MTDHFVLMALFAFFVSLVFAVLMRDDVRAQVRLGGVMFGAFMLAALVLGWFMLPIPL